MKLATAWLSCFFSTYQIRFSCFVGHTVTFAAIYLDLLSTILNSKRNAKFNVFGAWNMSIHNCMLNSWLFGVMLIKEDN